MKRTEKWFVCEIKKRLASNPKQEIIFDIDPDEHNCIIKAIFDPELKTQIRFPVEISNMENPHKTAHARKSDHRYRLVIYPIQAPQPIVAFTLDMKTEEVKPVCQYLKEKYGPTYHVEQYGDKNGDVFKVWLASDYLNHMHLLPHEIVDLAVGNIAMHNRNRKSSVAGGKARATCTDKQIMDAFKGYKYRNPEHSYAAAELKVADMLKYSSHRKLGERVNRMTGMTPSKWYKSLP